MIDERWFVQGNPGVARHDVAQAHGLPNLATCGFSIRFALNFVDPGLHTMRIVGRLPNGEWVDVGSSVEFEAIPPPLPWIWALVELRQPTLWGLQSVQFYSQDHDYKGESILPVPLSIDAGSGLFVSGWANRRAGNDSGLRQSISASTGIGERPFRRGTGPLHRNSRR